MHPAATSCDPFDALTEARGFTMEWSLSILKDEARPTSTAVAVAVGGGDGGNGAKSLVPTGKGFFHRSCSFHVSIRKSLWGPKSLGETSEIAESECDTQTRMLSGWLKPKFVFVLDTGGPGLLDPST